MSLLTGMRVVEVSSFVAAPLGGMTLAQLGAEVIRVDPIGGGPDRDRWPLASSGTSLYWAGLNKGKRSITADLRSHQGQELVSRLITAPGPEAGIVLTNQGGRPWLSYEQLSQRRHDLIHVGIQGHHDGSAAVDYTVNAETGFPHVTGPPEHAGPVNHVLPAWDMACGLQAALAILAADRQRLRSGQGQQVQLALADVALAMAGHLGFLAEAQVNGVDRGKVGNHLYGSFARDFATADGHRVMVVALTPRHWRDLVAVTGLSEAIAALESSLKADFSTEGDRYRYREVLTALLEPWFANRPLSDVQEALDRTSVLCSPYRSFTDLFSGGGQALRANPMMDDIDQPGIGEHLAPGSPLSLAGQARQPAEPAPQLGEHTDTVLGDLLDLSAAELAQLHEQAVVGGPS
ncbi:CoA transferase [Bounagaea algeriensis]